MITVTIDGIEKEVVSRCPTATGDEVLIVREGAQEQEPKVTECWVTETSDGLPYERSALDVECKTPPHRIDRPAILMWASDYDAMRNELSQLRKQLTWISAVNNANSKRGDIYLARLQELLPEEEVGALINKIVDHDTEDHDHE